MADRDVNLDSSRAPAATGRHLSRVLAVFLVGFVILLVSWQGGTHPFKNTHWLFNWDNGFVKRGLVGSVLFQFADKISLRSLIAIQYFVSVLAAAAMTGILAWSLRFSSTASGKPVLLTCFQCALLAAAILSAPGLIQQWLWDIGRFDTFGVLALCMSFVAVQAFGRLQSLFLCLAMSGLSILIHEAYFLWVAPAAMALWLDRWRTEAGSLLQAAAGMAALGALTFLVWKSSYERLFDLETAMSSLQPLADFEVNRGAVEIHYRDAAESVAYSMDQVQDLRNLAGLALGLLVLVAYAFVLKNLLGDTAHRSKEVAVTLLLCALAPLALTAVGHDVGRWLSMAQTSITFLFLGALIRSDEPLSPFTERRMLFLLLLPIVFISLGPAGIVISFPQAPLWSFLSLIDPS